MGDILVIAEHRKGETQGYYFEMLQKAAELGQELSARSLPFC
jgi:hypothetical protein